MGVPNKGIKQSFSPPFGNWDKEAKISRKKLKSRAYFQLK